MIPLNKVSKKFNCIVLRNAVYTYNPNNNVGKLIVEYQSGLKYHYDKVDLDSVKLLFENDEQYAFTAHNKYIDSKYRTKKKIYTKKWKNTMDVARKKQYLAKNNAARRARKQKAREVANAKSL